MLELNVGLRFVEVVRMVKSSGKLFRICYCLRVGIIFFRPKYQQKTAFLTQVRFAFEALKDF